MVFESFYAGSLELLPTYKIGNCVCQMHRLGYIKIKKIGDRPFLEVEVGRAGGIFLK